MKMVMIKRLDAQKETSLGISLEPQPKAYYLHGKGRLDLKTNDHAKEQLSKYHIERIRSIQLIGFHEGGLGRQKDRRAASFESQDTHEEEECMGEYMLII
jgi:hypothetical protein